jgi:hypothetical protein
LPHEINLRGGCFADMRSSGTSGTCGTECTAFNPKGIVTSSPGLRGTSYPGRRGPATANPDGVVAGTRPGGRNPIGVGVAWRGFPRVARASQPGALRRNPFGIHRAKSRCWRRDDPGVEERVGFEGHLLGVGLSGAGEKLSGFLLGPNFEHPTSNVEKRFSAEKALEGDLDKLG